MDLAMTINAWIDEEVIFAQQLGARQVFASLVPGEGPGSGLDPASTCDAPSLAKLANRVEKAGLTLAGLYVESTPKTDALAWAKRLVLSAGEAKINLLSLPGKSFPADWPILASAAAQTGGRMTLPAARMKALSEFRTTSQTFLERLPASVGLDAPPALLQGWLDQPDVSLRRIFLDKLWLVSFENGRQSKAQPTSRLEDLLALCWRLRQANYPGLVRLGRPSRWKGDTRGDHHARAFSTGYLRGVLQTFQDA